MQVNDRETGEAIDLDYTTVKGFGTGGDGCEIRLIDGRLLWVKQSFGAVWDGLTAEGWKQGEVENND